MCSDKFADAAPLGTSPDRGGSSQGRWEGEGGSSGFLSTAPWQAGVPLCGVIWLHHPSSPTKCDEKVSPYSALAPPVGGRVRRGSETPPGAGDGGVLCGAESAPASRLRAPLTLNSLPGLGAGRLVPGTLDPRRHRHQQQLP